ncbi:MBL fold metallo-hydrolase [Streptomyces sp. NPDC002176]|uniref:MBL fold metallo-hydrolase n=1 Tax=Streptomyces sp. NPDC002176 TaxID=3364634 RepID=UPI00384B5199
MTARPGAQAGAIGSGTAGAAAEIEEVLDGGLRRIVLTHGHEDHTGSAASLAVRGAAAALRAAAAATR